jgi:hypothetical protein
VRGGRQAGAVDIRVEILLLRMEGAVATTQVTGNPAAARQARIAAEILLAHALEG